MAAEILNVKQFVKNWKDELRSRVSRFVAEGNKKPSLTIIQVGDNPASNKYVDNKLKDCKEIGILADLYRIPEDVEMSQEDLNNLVYNCESDGIVIQLPLPQGLDAKEALEYTSARADVDGLTKLSPHTPATAEGIITYLDAIGTKYEGKRALVIGRSDLVGKPIAKLLLERDCMVVQAHSQVPREELDKEIAAADIIVCAVGKKGFLDLASTKDGAVVMDVGINFDESGKMVGDCWNHENAAPGIKVTPVPGGVGLLTRCALTKNVLVAHGE